MKERALVSASSDVGDLVELSRLLVSVAYRSLTAVDEPMLLPQFRAMAVLARYGPCTAGGLTDALGQHGSTVTRLCDKLVAQGWVTRQNRPENRREVELDLSDSGRDVVQQVLTARANELEQILRRMRKADRRALAGLLPLLLEAADDTVAHPREAWAV